ncbi:MAG: PTS sugar transporter subunit IIC [Lachnospiraceae bacterium]|nr:PTS sugar transporter subunit IIC [Lachnospiraceae bacterium]MBQ9122276.1 PTS sugar transporter subunit IIC [Lachnospiraceae bacterium]
MTKIYESKPMQLIKRFGEKVVANKGIQAISAGMMMTMGVILLGAVFQLLAVFLEMFGVIEQGGTLYNTLLAPHKVSMGFISLYVAFTIAYSYAKSLKMQAVTAGLNSVLLFFISSAPVKTVTLTDGASTFTGLDVMALDAKGMFMAIIVALTSVKLTHFFEKHNLVIKMPDAVPQFLQDTFKSLIPLVVNAAIWTLLGAGCAALTNTALPVLVTGLLGMPLAALTSVPGIIIIVLIAGLLWTMGVHGTVAVYAAIAAPLMQYYATNAVNHETGVALVFMPIALFGIINCCGGTGNTLALCVMGLFSKSEQVKAVSKAAIVPGIFNINEPAIFGFPIMYNPILAIPFILNPIITMLICWAGYAVGLFKPAFISVTATLPVGFAQYLTTLSPLNILIPVIAFVVAFVTYYPFFKAYEKTLIEKETKGEA